MLGTQMLKERKGKGDDDLDFNGRVECRFRRIWTGVEKRGKDRGECIWLVEL